MRFKFNIIAGLVTIVFAVAAFVLMGNLLDPQAPSSEIVAAPAIEVVPAVETADVQIKTVSEMVIESEFSEEMEPELSGPEIVSMISSIRDIHIEDNRVWVATPDGLIQTDRNGTHYRLIEIAEGVDPRMILEITTLPGRTLFCTDNEFY